MRYEIEISGQLDHRWSGWFGGLALEQPAAHRTRLVGDLTDQAALHGELGQLRDLGLEIVSVVRVNPDPSAAS